jgi:uncharacterized membrane protein
LFGYPIGPTLIFNWLLYGYGVPALAFVLATKQFGSRDDDLLVRVLEAGSALFTTLLLTVELRHALYGRVDAPLTDLGKDALTPLLRLLLGGFALWPMSERVSEPYFRVGEGKISGWISVLLGALNVLGVLCFRFPDFLTTPQLRAAYTVDEMRYLLGAGMIFSAGFGLVTFALNRHELMGAIGISLTLLAMWGGGATVQVGPRYAAPGYVGLDWFILDLMLSAIIFIFLEKLFPYIRRRFCAPIGGTTRGISCSTTC